MTKAMQVNTALLDSMRISTLRPSPIPIEPGLPGEFKIINNLWLNPIDNLAATLADLPDGRRVVRRSIPGQYGKPVLLYWEVPKDDTGARPVTLKGYDDTLARPHHMVDQINGVSPNGQAGTIEPTPLQIEVDRFKAAYPHIAHHLGLVALAPQRAFDPGPCYRPSQGTAWPKYDPKKTGDIDFSKFRDRHCGGDFGFHGMLADAAPLDDATRFTLGLQPQLIQNVEALESRLGAVRSDYPCEGLDGHRYTVVAITALMPDPRKTFTVFHVNA
ncbi:MAG: hypothetical protein ACLQGP_15760 [Isosphaeraceae bacterium]